VTHNALKIQNRLPIKKLNTTFSEVTSEWLPLHDIKIKNEKERAYARARLNTHILPFIGGMKIEDIKSADILVLLKRLESRNSYEMTRRIRALCSQIFRYESLRCACSSY
jgi:integrase